VATQVYEATFAIRDALTERIEAVYGLTTMHGCVKSFTSVPPPSDIEDGAELKTTSYCFGLSALGKFIRRLPGEILEEELPRLKDTLISVGGVVIVKLRLLTSGFLSPPRVSRTPPRC
jgi:CLIP-associating protein 1/2